ncbi:MAG TPA: hypothetical protein VF534_05940 [Paraburkholderia sp.]
MDSIAEIEVQSAGQRCVALEIIRPTTSKEGLVRQIGLRCGAQTGLRELEFRRAAMTARREACVLTTWSSQ